jgi:hypothetical protein
LDSSPRPATYHLTELPEAPEVIWEDEEYIACS